MADLLIDESKLTKLGEMVTAQEKLLQLFGENHGAIDALLAEMYLAGQGGVPTGPTIYGQRDLPWAPKMLGKSTKYTIYSSGCLMCAYAGITTDAGLRMAPDEMNSWLIANNGYLTDSEGQVVNFNFSRGDKLGVLKFDGIDRCSTTAAPVAKIEKYVKDGGFVIVQVHRAGVPQHWVRYLGQNKCVDPWFDDIADLMPRYLGNNLEQAILAAAYYKKVTPKG